MNGQGIIAFAGTIVVVIIYSIFSFLSTKVKKLTSKTNHIVTPNVMSQLNIKDKDSIIKGIDHCIDIKDYEGALKLCEMYVEYNKDDIDISKRKKYIKNLID